MAQLPIDEALNRFKDNEDRLDKFVNSDAGYTASTGEPVESIPAFLERVESEIEQTTGTVAANLAASEQAKTDAQDAAAASIFNKGVFGTVDAALSKGVKEVVNIVGGSGGTNGTYALGFSSANASTGYFVVSGGSVIDVTITNPGVLYGSPPTLSFSACPGLTGASATAVIAQNVGPYEYFHVVESGQPWAFKTYVVDSGGTTATLIAQSPSYPLADYSSFSSNLQKQIAARTQSIFTPLTLEQNAADANFVSYYNKFFGIMLSVPKDLNGSYKPRLFITRIGVKSSDSADVNKIGVRISQLKADNTVEVIAEGFTPGSYSDNFDGLTFAFNEITGVGAYAGLISGYVRIERTTAWNYFYADGVFADQLSRTYSVPTPTTGSFEIDPAFVSFNYTYDDAPSNFKSAFAQDSKGIFALTTIEQNKADAGFFEHVNKFFDFKINVANSIDSLPYKRLYISAISSELDVLNMPVVEISYLNAANAFVKIAEARQSSTAVNVNHYDANNKFVEYTIAAVAGYEGKVSGSFKWERTKGWNYYFNDDVPITYTDTTPHLGSYEISQDCVTYFDDSGSVFKPLPETPYYSGSLDEISNFRNHWLKADKDVVIVCLGDSIMTAINYTTDRTDAKTRPPLCHQSNLFSFIEEKLRWKGQEYKRFDVAGTFTETASSASTVEYDEAWDWQINPPVVPTIDANFKPAITRVLNGSNISVAYTYPAGMRRCNFIYRTDYLCAASSTVAIAQGNGKVEVFDEGSQTWVEANGYSFSMKEADSVINYERTDYDGSTYTDPLRKSAYQRRLKMRSLTDLNAKGVTIANVGSGRLNYWGIEYSQRSNMITLINSARGGHNISRLRAFEAWDVDYWKPDLIALLNPVINEGAMSAAGMSSNNKPSDFAGRFGAYATLLKAKAYAPDFMAMTMFVGSQAQIVDTSTGKYNVGTIAGYGDVTVFDYIGYLDSTLKTNGVLHLNMFYEFLQIAEQKADFEKTNNIWTSAIVGSSKTGATFTIDNVHPNDYGNLIAKSLVVPLFKFVN